jgi:acyl carrier protein
MREVSNLTGLPSSSITEETRLIGGDTGLSSLHLVTVLLALEEFAEDTLHVRFDWTNDSAMSENRSIYRTIGSLADHISGLSAS